MIILTIGLGCSLLPLTSTSAPSVSQTTQAPLPPAQTNITLQSEITFQVEIPQNSPPDQPVFLNILEEVSGLALNMQTYPMDMADQRHFSLTLSLPFGSVVKYRYSRQGEISTVEEHLSDGRPVRYRLYHVEGPGVVQDVITRWTDTPAQGPSGRIVGHAINSENGQPIPNLLIVAGGAHTLTASDGSFLIEGLPPGIHNLVALSMDGAYRTFQQGALVAPESATPAEIQLKTAKVVNVTFNVSVPADTIPAVPIRLAGNLYQLGNMFSDLSGGMNTIASRMPILNLKPDGHYSITLPLPSGIDLHYLYTQGDGYWNTELFPDGNRRVRQVIIPENDIVLNDVIESWHIPNATPLIFDVTVPPNTPTGDFVSIQFNPFYGWTEPIPMWHLGENRWAFVLNHPLQMIGGTRYRYCRNDQCGTADDSQTAGPDNPGHPIRSATPSQILADRVETWAWLENTPMPAVVDAKPVGARGAGFIAGIEFQSGYHPTRLPRFPATLNDLQSLGANWVFLTPSWSYTRNSPPVLELVLGEDASWFDLVDMISQTRQRGINVAIFPTPHFQTPVSQWWLEAKRDFPWWVVWFERYRTFTLHHADLATQSGAQALVLGGDWLSPALPAGVLSDGTPSGVPADAEIRWRNLIQELRTRFNGSIIWALPYSQVDNPPRFLDSVDQIYVLFNAPLASNNNPSRIDLEAQATQLLDDRLLPLQYLFGKPLLLGLTYPSIDGAVTSCLPTPVGGCSDLSPLAQPAADIPQSNLDLVEQADIYSALLSAINTRPWIGGLISRGYYPPAALQDKSTSVHGKPAEEVLKYWFPRLLGLLQ